MLRCPMDPKGASRKWTKTRRQNEKLVHVCVCMHVPCDYKIPKEQISYHRDFFWRKGLFWSEWKLHWVSGFWESLVQMASTVKISFPTLMLHTILHLLFSDSHQVTWLYTPKRQIYKYFLKRNENTLYTTVAMYNL